LRQQGGKGSQTSAISENITSSDLWAFFQAKTVRQAALRLAADSLVATVSGESNAAVKSKRKED
jgi:hypothetical protein